MSGPIDEYAVTLVERLRKARDGGRDEVEACKRVLGALLESAMAHRDFERLEQASERAKANAIRVTAIACGERVDGGTVGELRELLAVSGLGDGRRVIVVRPTATGAARDNCYDACDVTGMRVSDYEQDDALYIEIGGER